MNRRRRKWPCETGGGVGGPWACVCFGESSRDRERLSLMGSDARWRETGEEIRHGPAHAHMVDRKGRITEWNK